MTPPLPAKQVRRLLKAAHKPTLDERVAAARKNLGLCPKCGSAKCRKHK